MLILGLAIPFLFEMPETAVLRDLGAAVLTVIGAMGLAWAYARAEAQVLVPLEYSGFLWASLFGWLFFAEELTLPTAAGTAIIMGMLAGDTRGDATTADRDRSTQWPPGRAARSP